LLTLFEDSFIFSSSLEDLLSCLTTVNCIFFSGFFLLCSFKSFRKCWIIRLTNSDIKVFIEIAYFECNFAASRLIIKLYFLLFMFATNSTFELENWLTFKWVVLSLWFICKPSNSASFWSQLNASLWCFKIILNFTNLAYWLKEIILAHYFPCHSRMLLNVLHIYSHTHAFLKHVFQ
jgi:hypothetical protein